MDRVGIDAGTIPDEPCELPDHGSSISAGVPVNNIAWNVLKNSAVQIGGRLLIGLSRLLLAGIIVRAYGQATFGQYSLIFAMLTITEWLLDFGTCDVFVRDICRDPASGPRKLRILMAARSCQLPVAFGALAIILMALHYPQSTLKAGLLAGLSMSFYAYVLVYRVGFRVTLTTERDVIAELISVIVLVFSVALVCKAGWGLAAIFVCQIVSRAVFLVVCVFLGRDFYRPSLRDFRTSGAVESLRLSAPIGVSGLLVLVYETVDILLLARLAGFNDVAYYSAAQRFIWPLLLVQQSIGSAMYSVIASHWPRSPKAFADACQRCFETVLLVGGLPIVSMIAGAYFFVGLLGHRLAEGAPVLRILAAMCFVKAVSSTIGPVLYIVKAQKQVLRFIIVALLIKIIVVAMMAHWYGFMGTAAGALIVDICCVAAPSIYLVQRLTSYRVQWRVPLKALASALLASLLTTFLLREHAFAAAWLAPAIYLTLIFASGAIRMSEVRLLLKRERPVLAAADV